MEVKLNKESYKINGFIIKKSLLDKNYCDELVSSFKKKKPKFLVPFSKEPIGYGNLVKNRSFKNILDNKFINNFVKEMIGSDIEFNHLMIANKPAWIGPDAEFHQEVYNIKTYAPGYSSKDYKQFMQIFIALEDQTKDNGRLRIIPMSHTLGELPNEDFLSSSFSHKRRTKQFYLNKAAKKFGVLDVNLKKGDVIFFNHLLIHGSSNNISAKSRYAIVLQARKKNIIKDEKIFLKETKYRRDFIIKNIKILENKLKNTNKYKDFIKK